MSRLAAPGFSRLKAPGYSGIRQPSAIVSSANGTTALQNTTGTVSQQISTGTAAPQARSGLKKPSNLQIAENHQSEHNNKAGKSIPGLSQSKGSKSASKLAANQAVQHGTGPYDLPANHNQSNGSIPYVGKKRPAGVLKAPDSRSNMTKSHMSNGSGSALAEKSAKKKIIPPKENGTFAVPARPASKRMSSASPVNKYQGCSDLSKLDSSRRQTIGGTPDTIRTQSKFGSKNSSTLTSGIRPRSCVMPTKSTEIRKPEQKKSISKSLQNIPKSIPGISLPTMSRGLNKRDTRKSGSSDDILNCTKKESPIKRPVAGVIPRTKTGGFTSKFGFSKPSDLARPRSASSNPNGISAVSSTPHHTSNEIKNFDDPILSPIGIDKNGARNRLEDEFDNDIVPLDQAVADTSFHSSQPIMNSETVNGRSNTTTEVCQVMDIENVINDTVNKTTGDDSSGDTKTINIIINLDTVSASQEFNTTATLSKNDVINNNSLDKSNNKNTTFTPTATPNKTRNVDLDFNRIAVVSSNNHLNSTQTLNKTRNVDMNCTKTLNVLNDDSSPVGDKLNKTFEKSPIPGAANLNATQIIDNGYVHKNNNNDENILNRTHVVSDASELLNKTHVLNGERELLNKTQTINSIPDPMNQTVVLDYKPVNATRVMPIDSMDKSDSGFDDTNFNISDIGPPEFMNSMSEDVSYDGTLSADVLNVIAAISSNINRPTNITSFSKSPIKSSNAGTPVQNSSYICSVGTEEYSMTEDAWLTDDVEPPALEDTLSQTSQEEVSHTLYQTDDMLSKSTSIDMSTFTSNNTNWQERSHLMKFSANYENQEVHQVVANRTLIVDEVFKDNHDAESLCTDDISQSTDQLRNCLSSIGTDTEDIADIDTLSDGNMLHNPDSINEDSIFIGGKIDDESSMTDHLSSNNCLSTRNGSSSLNSTHTMINTSIGLDKLSSSARVNDIEIPTSIEYSDMNTSITDKTSCLSYTNNTIVEDCNESISKEIADAIIRDSGHSTDVNENEINSALSAGLNKLNITSVKADLFGDEVTESSENYPSTPPSEYEKSISSDVTYPSTPLSRQESLENELARRCNTIDCSRKFRKVARSRTYSSCELITKFRIPKELKCVETSDGDILMDKTTFLHFMNEVKLVKTSLFKLKRTLAEAECQSPLVKSPLKRANSAVEASAIPPLSPRTCQCSPMAVVNPLVLNSTGSISTPTKEKGNMLSLEEQIAFLNEKLEVVQSQFDDSSSTVKLLQTQLENHEQKEQDIIEENILLREEISHLTERLRVARGPEADDGAPGSFEEFDLAVDLDSRLSILQRLYSDG